MDKFKAVFRGIDQLVPYSRNARTHSADQVSQLAASILEWGWTNPILADDKGVVAGHGRLAAARLLYSRGEVLRLPSGDTIPSGAVPVIDVSGWSESKRRAYVLADNKLSLGAGWDEALLAEELKALKEDDFDLGLAGFTDEEASRVLSGMNLGTGVSNFLDSFSLEDSADKTGESGDRERVVYGDYTRKIVAPIYEITGEQPEVSELYDDSKALRLVEAIQAANLPPEVTRFLEKAAERHTEFHFAKIAEFYAHAAPEVQRLFEASVLVIIDFDQAVEQGFITLHKDFDVVMAEDDASGLQSEDYSEDEEELNA
jgi:hypothetical protein